MRLLDFIFAARPMLLLPVWSIYLVTHHFLNLDGKIGAKAFVTLSAISLLMAGSYLINQIYDFQSDVINNKIGFLQRGYLEKREIAAAYFSTTVVGTAISAFLGLTFMIIALLIVLLGFFYSSPPLRLKDRPLWGLLANGIGYGVLMPLSAASYRKLEFSLLGLLILYFSLTVSAIYLITAIIDREGDQRTGKHTLSTKYSERGLVIIGLTLVAGSLIVFARMNLWPLGVMSVATFTLFLVLMIAQSQRLLLFSSKFPILLLTLLAGYYYPVYLVFVLVLIIACRLYYKKRFGMIYPKLS